MFIISKSIIYIICHKRKEKQSTNDFIKILLQYISMEYQNNRNKWMDKHH